MLPPLKLDTTPARDNPTQLDYCTCRHHHGPQTCIGPLGHFRLDAKATPDLQTWVKLLVWCLFQRTGEGGCGAESKGWDLLFQSEKELMVDHRNSGSEIHGVPRGQVVQWHPLLPPRSASSCHNLRPTTLAGGAHLYRCFDPSRLLNGQPIKGEWEKFTWMLLEVLWFNCLFFLICCSYGKTCKNKKYKNNKSVSTSNVNTSWHRQVAVEPWIYTVQIFIMNKQN